MSSGTSDEGKFLEDRDFDTEMTLLRIESFIENESYLNAIELLFELDSEKFLKEKAEELLTLIKNKGEFIENGLRGQSCYKNRNYEQALEYLKLYTKENPRDAKGWEFQAQIYEKNNDYENALECYEKQVKLTGNLKIYRKQASCYYKLGDIKETIACLDYIIEKNPDDKDAAEFKKSCLRDYRTSGLKEHVRRKSLRDEEESPKKERVKIIWQIMLLGIVFTSLFGIAIFFLTKTSRALKNIDSEDNNVRLDSVVALSGNNDEEAINALVEKLKDKNSGIRATTVCILGETGNESVVEPIMGLTKDRDWSVRKNVMEALGKLNDTRAVKPLIKVIKNHEEMVLVRLEALKSLEAISSEALSPIVPDLIKDPEKKIRIYIVEFIERMNLKSHLPVLKLALKNELSKDVSESMARAISKLTAEENK